MLYNLYNAEGQKVNRSKLNEVQAQTMKRLTALNYGRILTIIPAENGDSNVHVPT